MSKIDKSTLLQFQGASSGTWHGGGDGTTIHHGDIHSRFAHIYIYKHMYILYALQHLYGKKLICVLIMVMMIIEHWATSTCIYAYMYHVCM